MKRKILYCVFLCSLALNIGFIGVCAVNFISRSEPVVPQNCPFIAKYTHMYSSLGLSQQQLETIEPLAEKFHNNTQAIGALIVEQRNRLVAEMAKENVSQEAIDAIHGNIGAMQSKIQQLVVSHILEIKNIMTPEQRKEFFSAIQRSFQTQSFKPH